MEEFKQAGVAAILPKPFEPLHLSRALNASLDLINHDELELDLFDVHDVRVLLVDDSKLARNHIRRVLNNLGLLKVTEAEDGQQAIEKLESDFNEKRAVKQVQCAEKNKAISIQNFTLWKIIL